MSVDYPEIVYGAVYEEVSSKCRPNDECDVLSKIHPKAETLIHIPDDTAGESTVFDTLTASAGMSKLQLQLTKCSEAYSEFKNKNRKKIKVTIVVILVLLYSAYFIYAMTYSFGDEGSTRLLWMTCLVLAVVLYQFVREYSKKTNSFRELEAFMHKVGQHESTINWVALGIISSVVLLFVIIDVSVVSRNPYNLVSGCGIIFYIILLFVLSRNPSKVSLRTVGWGLCLQFVFALIILRTQFGLVVFEWIGDRVTTFFSYADHGCQFVFGDKYKDHLFAFKVLPVVIFFSSIVSVLYHLGVMQIVAAKIAWVMQITMGTTAGESLIAAANIFLSQTEALLLVKPFLHEMTAAELHSIMTSGFSTVSGSILAAYIYFGVSARHLISASVMSAPAALAMSKLICPETEASKNTADSVVNCKVEVEGNVIEALSTGAVSAVKLIAAIVANLIAFIATLHFINGILTWFGNRVGIELLTFQMICSYVLWPLALVMGVEVPDCRRVAQLIGVKTFLNEFIAYESLGVYINNKRQFDSHVINNGTWYNSGDDVILLNPTMTSQIVSNETVLLGGFMSDRSIAISTYALCGFSNCGSMGIMLGALSSLAPQHKSVLATLVVRALVAGSVACFITACIAGLFYQGE